MINKLVGYAKKNKIRLLVEEDKTNTLFIYCDAVNEKEIKKSVKSYKIPNKIKYTLTDEKIMYKTLPEYVKLEYEKDVKYRFLTDRKLKTIDNVIIVDDIETDKIREFIIFSKNTNGKSLEDIYKIFNSLFDIKYRVNIYNKNTYVFYKWKYRSKQ